MSDAVNQLIERFNTIGESLKDLPFYNQAMEVEALGFIETDEHHIGVLITPWFMNIMLLFKQAPQENVALGQWVKHELPSGEQSFMVGEEDVLGRYDFISLVSPTLKFKSQDEARAEAIKALQKYMTPPEEQRANIPEQPVRFVSDEKTGMDRRAFLRGDYKS